MTTIVIVGGGIGGLATALAVAGRGRRVVLLEQDGPPPEGPPGPAGQRWGRPHVASWRHAQILTSVGVSVLRERAPQVLAEATRAGGVLLDLLQAMPPDPAGRIDRDIDRDDELVAFACRRATLEVVLYRMVRALPDVEIRHRVRVGGLLLSAGRDRVTGVRCADGERIPAGIVIDATGRRAAARSWLAADGIALDDDLTSPTGIRVFSRFYELRGSRPDQSQSDEPRSDYLGSDDLGSAEPRAGGVRPDGSWPGASRPGASQPGPLNRGNAAGVVNDTYVAVLHPADNGTVSVSLGVLPEDKTMRALRDPRAFTAAAMVSPGVVDWLTRGGFSPLSGVRTFTCTPNALGTLATALPPPITGLIPVGDAACVTNPLYGRGVSLSIAHAFAIGDLLCAHPEPGPAQSHEAAKIARELFTPWYRQATADDADRIARWEAALNGAPLPPLPDVLTIRTVGAVAGGDAFIWRGLMRVLMGLRTPAEVFGDAEFEDRVRRALAARATSPPPVAAQPPAPATTATAPGPGPGPGPRTRPGPGPSRAELVAAVTAAVGR